MKCQSLILLVLVALGTFCVVQAQGPGRGDESTTGSEGMPAPSVLPQDAEHYVAVRGRVEDSAGNPLEGVMVQLQAFTGGVLGTMVTNPVGDFEFKTTTRGPYELDVTTANVEQRVTLGEGDAGQVVIRLRTNANASAAANPAGKAPTVSLNDLEASSKARSKLSGAQQALAKLDLAKAWKLVNEAIAAAPNWGRAYMVRGVLNMANHNLGPARADLTVAVQRDPEDGMALTELGKLYATTGNLQLADLYLRRALQIEPVLWPTYFELASLDLRRGNNTEARKMAQSALSATPPAPPSAHFLEAEAAENLGDSAAAALEYRSFVALTEATPQTGPALAAARQRITQLEKH